MRSNIKSVDRVAVENKLKHAINRASGRNHSEVPDDIVRKGSHGLSGHALYQQAPPTSIKRHHRSNMITDLDDYTDKVLSYREKYTKKSDLKGNSYGAKN